MSCTAFATYCKSLSRTPPCTSDEAISLARKFRSGDSKAGHKLVEGHLRFAFEIARQLLPRSRSIDLDELVQEANHGLLLARDRFDPERGVKFTTYAAWWVKALVLRYLMQSARLVQIGKTRKSRKEFYAGTLKHTLEISIESLIPGTDIPYLETLSGGARPDELVEEADRRQHLSHRLTQVTEKLSGRELDIYQRHWLTESPVTLETISHTYGVSRERIRQIKVKMLKHLREDLADVA